MNTTATLQSVSERGEQTALRELNGTLLLVYTFMVSSPPVNHLTDDIIRVWMPPRQSETDITALTERSRKCV